MVDADLPDNLKERLYPDIRPLVVVYYLDQVCPANLDRAAHVENVQECPTAPWIRGALGFNVSSRPVRTISRFFYAPCRRMTAFRSLLQYFPPK